MNPNGYLELILGCMWSGKSNRLISLYKKYKLSGYNPVIINFAGIKNQTNTMVTHDNKSCNCIYTHELNGVININNPTTFLDTKDIILINEGQFYPDIYQWTLFVVNNLKKTVHIAALDSDFQSNPFSNIIKLIPQSDYFKKLTAICAICKDGTPAIFTKRTSSCTKQILFDETQYKPVCRKCFNKSI